MARRESGPHGKRRRRLCAALVVCCGLPLLIGGAVASRARAGPPTEYEVKAAFVYNFAKFVEWPAEAFDSVTAPLTIGILGEDPFGPTMAEAIEDKQAAGRPLRLRRIDDAAHARGCQILFVNVPPADLKETLRRVDPAGLLLVGEGEAFLREGGVIALVMDGNRVSFEINLAAAERAGLRLSSKLLNLARDVGRWPRKAEKS